MTRQAALYIHIPFCLSKCDYCDFFSVKCRGGVPQEYIDALCTELDFKMKLLQKDSSLQINTIYIGGGTPSLLTKKELKQLCDRIFSYNISSDYEFTVEVNPDDVNQELLMTLQECGVNRISCGVQSFSQTVLKSVHRRAGLDQVCAALECIAQFWKGRISVDLICGLPGETLQSLKEGLDKLCAVRNYQGNPVHHISFYSLSLEENTPLYSKIEKGQADYDSDFADKLWLSGRDFLLSKGYKQYEVSNFCLPDNDCRHNMVYWESKDYIGIGSGATGTIHKADGSAIRTTGITDIQAYIKNPCSSYLTENISTETARFEFFMMGLRTAKGVDRFRFKSIFNTDFSQKTLELFEQWINKGLAAVKKDEDGEFYSLTQQGLLFLNTFLEQII